MELDEWLRAVAAELDLEEVDFSNDTVHTLLDLARDSAHEIERIAAPLTTYLVGCRRRREAPLSGRRRRRSPSCALHRPPGVDRPTSLGACAGSGCDGLSSSSSWPRSAWCSSISVTGNWIGWTNGGRGTRPRSATNRRRRSRRARSSYRPIGEADQWKKATATGTFDAEHQFVIRYRNNGGEEGYQVVTPLANGLRRAAGRPRLRGLAARRCPIPSTAPAPPAGTVTVEGYVRRNEQGNAGAIQPENGQVRLINSDALQTALPYPVANGYLSVLTVDPPQSGGVRADPAAGAERGTALLVRGPVVHVRRHRDLGHRGLHPRRSS